MNPAKAIYHKFIPGAVRNPLGMARRRLADRWARLVHPGPLPPERLISSVHASELIGEFVRIGDRSADAIRSAFRTRVAPDARVLDLLCGCGRTMLPLSRTTRWRLSGADVDSEALRWLAGSIAASTVLLDPLAPPLPFGDATFDAVYAVSVFTHLAQSEQKLWSAELARILVPGGLALITTMGPGVIEAFPAHATAANRLALRDEGFACSGGARSFDERLAFHTAGGVSRLMSPAFDLWQHLERGLDGFEDLVLLVRR